jgi:hypothetical protein
MTNMRPGVKITFWSPRFKNKGSVEPPGLLRLTSALAIASIVGVLLYAALTSISGIGSAPAIEAEKAIYIAVLHFALPFGLAYAVSTNHPVSRLLIALYAAILCGATVMGKGVLGTLNTDDTVRSLGSMVFLLVVLYWLYATPKMRYYYALISDQPVPDDLQSRASELSGKKWINPKIRAVLDWVVDHLETVVLLGFIAAVIYAFVSTG